jgi:hypothetical protein
VHCRARRRPALLAGTQRALERGAEFLVHELALLAGPPAALLVAGLRRPAPVAAAAVATQQMTAAYLRMSRPAMRAR